MHICWHSALLTGLAGGATAQAMALWGGSLARFLPPWSVLTVAAFAGAALAGLICARLFGRAGGWGWARATLSWPVVTALGAGLASTFLTVTERTGRSIGHAVENGAPLGLIAAADGITTSPVVAGVWVLSGLLVQKGMTAQRALT